MSTLLRFLLVQSALIPASLSRVLCATCLCLGSSVNGPNDNMDKHIIEVWIILIDQTQNIIKQKCESWRDEILWRTQRHSPSMLDHQISSVSRTLVISNQGFSCHPSRGTFGLKRLQFKKHGSAWRRPMSQTVGSFKKIPGNWNLQVPTSRLEEGYAFCWSLFFCKYTPED